MRTLILRLLPILFLISSLSAGTYDLLTDKLALSFPDTSDIERPMIDYSVSHQELFRSSRNDTLLSRFTIRNQNLKFNYKFNDFSLLASWKRNILNIDDMLNSEYTNTIFKPILHEFNLQMSAKIKTWLLKPGLSFSFSGIVDTLFIIKYPNSDQNAMNIFFFDLLPETFGDSIHFKHSQNSIRGDLLAKSKKLAFYFSYRYGSNRVIESHENTTSFSSLKGPRESIAILNNSNLRFILGYSINPDHYIWGGIELNRGPLDWHHTIYPGNPIPSEIIQLSGGTNNTFQSQLGYQAELDHFNIGISMAEGNIHVSDTASTPVLGYFMSFFPISHQADLSLNTTYILGKFHADYEWTIHKSIIIPKLDISVIRSWTDIDFEALLQFGLEDIRIMERYIHQTYLIALGCNAQIYLNSDLNLNIELEQLIPYLKTISPELPPPPPPDGTKRYGGLSVKIGVSMSW